MTSAGDVELWRRQQTAEYLLGEIRPQVQAILPPGYFTTRADAQLLATALQESRLLYHRQVGGPALGYWQFERGGGVKLTLKHPASRTLAADLCRRRGYNPSALDAVYQALEFDDVLGWGMARLYLATDRRPLPTSPADPARGWTIYRDVWNPGKPHRATWDEYYAEAWRYAEAYARRVAAPPPPVPL